MSMNNIQLEDVVRQASDWNFAGDTVLLQWMQQISQELEKKANQSCEALRMLDKNVKSTSIALENMANSLSSLQFGDQFVESRVQDDDETLVYSRKGAPTLPKSQSNILSPNSSKEICDQFLSNNLKMLHSCHEKYSLDLEDSDNDMGENSANNTYIYQPINPYSKKALPYIFGSKQWHDHWHVGLCETQSSEFSGDELSDEFSEVSATDENESFESNTPNISQWTSSCSLQNETLRTKFEVKHPSSMKGLQTVFPNKPSNNAVESRVQGKETNSTNSESLKNTNSIPSNPPLFDDIKFDTQIETVSQHSTVSHVDSQTNSNEKCTTKPDVGFVDLFAEPENINVKSTSAPEHHIKRNAVNLFDDDDDDDDDFKSYMDEVAKKAQPENKKEERDIIVPKQDILSHESEQPTSSLKTKFLAKSLFDDDFDEVDDFFNMFANKKAEVKATKPLSKSLLFDDGELSSPLEKKDTIVNLFENDNSTVSEDIPTDKNAFVKKDAYDSKEEHSETNSVNEDTSKSIEKIPSVVPRSIFNKSDEDEDLSDDLFAKSAAMLNTSSNEKLSIPPKELSPKIKATEKLIEKPAEKTVLNNQENNYRENLNEFIKEEVQSKASALNNKTTVVDSDNTVQKEDSLMITSKINENVEPSEPSQRDKLTAQVNNYNFNASLFLQEPPDDNEYFDSFRNSPPTTTFKHNSSADLVDDFYEPELPNLPISHEQAQKTINAEPYNAYNALQCFNEVPPEDEGDHFVNTLENSTTLSNIFYDDLSETMKAVNKNRDHEVPAYSGINDKKFKRIDIDFWETEANTVKEPEVDQQKLKPSKLEIPNIQINVKALLPGSNYRKSSELKEEKYLAQTAKVPDSYNAPKINLDQKEPWPSTSQPNSEESDQAVEKSSSKVDDHNAKFSLDKKEQLPDKQYLLSSINKTRVRAPISRKPSTRKGRQQSYEKSLRAEQEANEDILGNSASDSKIREIMPEGTSPFSKGKTVKIDEGKNNDFESLFAPHTVNRVSLPDSKGESMLKNNQPSLDLFENMFAETIEPNKLTSADVVPSIKETISAHNNGNDLLSASVIVDGPVAAKRESQLIHQQLNQSKPIVTKSTNLFDDSESDDDFFANNKKSFLSTKSDSKAKQTDETNANVKTTETERKTSIIKSEPSYAQNKNMSSLFDGDSEDDDLFLKRNRAKSTTRQKSQDLFANDDENDDDDLFFKTKQAKPSWRPKSKNLLDNGSDDDDDDDDDLFSGNTLKRRGCARYL
uniref:FAM21/CAPZIP domain-containing protein n=1 Tax=Glossina morsitans morsitans TaxID=37546 RepID=A0A1B0G5T5_GLOMM